MAMIHATALVDPQCQIDPSAEIGPFCRLTGAVILGPNVRLLANVHMQGPVRVGAGCLFYPGSCIGFEPQDFKFKPGMTTAGVAIGSNCVFREHVTINAASKADVPTTIGDDCYLMIASHMGHDSRIGNRVILGNSALLAGHSQVFDQAILSGNTAIHQFNRVGRLAFVSGGAVSSMDVPPFCVAINRHEINGVNLVGMRRSGMPREHITRVRQAYAAVFRGGVPRQEQIERLTELGRDCPPVMEIADFVRSAKRAVSAARGTHRREEDLPES